MAGAIAGGAAVAGIVTPGMIAGALMFGLLLIGPASVGAGTVGLVALAARGIQLGAIALGGYLGGKLGGSLYDYLTDPLTPDPLVVDLDGDGIELIGIDSSHAYFDMNAWDGVSRSAWVGPDDGFLALDRNEDGFIGDNSELFSEFAVQGATSGFAALSALDSDGNGVLNALDSDFSDLVIWRDLDGNGISDSGELYALTSLDIASISLSSTPTGQQSATSSVVIGRASATLSNGTTLALAEVLLAGDRIEYNRVLPSSQASTVAGSSGQDLIDAGGWVGAISAGDGSDVIYVDSDDVTIDGGAGTDALVFATNDSIDFAFGAANVELVVGGAGNDTISGMGGSDALIFGGAGDDSLIGTDGSDILIGGLGNDTIDGGTGVDLASFDGVRSEFTVSTFGAVTTVERIATGESDELTNVERLSFQDTVEHLSAPNQRPAVATTEYFVRSGEDLVFTEDDLLTRAVDPDNDLLEITALGDVVGGTVSFEADGRIRFSPLPNFTGTASFEFSVSDGHGGLAQAGAVIRVIKAAPTDSYVGNQYYLSQIRADAIWDRYTGAGVIVGIADDGVEYTHPDLQPQYDTSIDYNYTSGTADGAAASSHGTSLAGVIAAARNGQGVVGIAYDATITSYLTLEDFLVAWNSASWPRFNVDVVNNSWTAPDDFHTWSIGYDAQAAANGAANVAAQGRGGLGTVVVAAAGNYRETGSNTGYHLLQASRHVISVAATDIEGKVAPFSTPGASVLVSAPGVDIVTTDRQGSGGYTASGPGGADYVSMNGTSYSSAVVSGVVALMLEANPELGYRDIQEILAYTARLTDPVSGSWQVNAAGTSNGGGLHFSNDYGFGLVDAAAAVRLAEVWEGQRTAANEVAISNVKSVSAAIPDNGVLVSTLDVAASCKIDRVSVQLNITHAMMGDLVIKVTSPGGTTCVLADRPGKLPDDPTSRGYSGNFNWTLPSNEFWGESATGTWTLTVEDAASEFTGSLGSWTLRLYGDADAADDVYIYTGEFGAYSHDLSRRVLDDAGGNDTINTAAITSDVLIDLRSGESSLLAGSWFSLAAGTVIENAVTGDGHDVLVGNDGANRLFGGRGDDFLTGGAGADTLQGSDGVDAAVYAHSSSGVTVDLSTGLGQGGDADGDSLSGIERLVGSDFADTLIGAAGDNALDGGTGDDVLEGGDGNDVLSGGDGNDVIDGGAGNDVATYVGAYASYAVTLSGGSATVAGAEGTDVLSNVEFLSFSDQLVYVGGANSAPVAATLSLATSEDEPLTISAASVLALATDGDSDPLEMVAVSRATSGSVELDESGNIRFIPDSNFSGVASFTYTIRDGKGGVGSGTVNVTVNAANDAPVAVNSLAVTPFETALSGKLPVNDQDHTPGQLTYSTITAPTKGSLTINPDGTYLYTPNVGATGSDTFSFSATDPGSLSSTATVSIEISPQFEVQSPRFNVSTATLSWQASPAVTALLDGRVVIAFHAGSTPGDINGISARIFDSAGSPLTSDFRVNTHTASDVGVPAITALADGGFVVTWHSAGQDGSGLGVYAQRYDKHVAPVGGEFRVSSVTSGDQSVNRGSVFALPDGGFVVTWNDFGRDGSDFAVFGKRYNSDNNPVGAEFQINTYTTGFQSRPVGAALANGAFVIAWESNNQDGSGVGVYAQRFDVNGSPVGSEFRVNTWTANNQGQPSIAALLDGGFVVVWLSRAQDSGTSLGVYGQRYDSSGSPSGAEFRINTYTAGDQASARVVALTNGGFVVTWHSNGQDGSGLGAYAQRYDAQGAKVGPEFRVSQATSGDQEVPDVAALPGGGFVIGYMSPDGSLDGTYANLFTVAQDITGSAGADTLIGSAGNDTFQGGGGDDVLEGRDGADLLAGASGADSMLGGAGNDILEGGEGSDTLRGGSGDDELEGGSGNDILEGNGGSDVYLVGRGGGLDTIENNDASSSIDSVWFGAYVDRSQIWFARVGNDLHATVIGTSDGVVLKDWYVGASNRVDDFRTADGAILPADRVEQLVVAMANLTPPAAGDLTLSEDLTTALGTPLNAWQTPVVTSMAVTPFRTAVSGQLSANNVSQMTGTLTYDLLVRPENGVLVLNADGSYTYRPDPNYSGADSFTYRATNLSGETRDAIVSIDVSAPEPLQRGIERRINVVADGDQFAPISAALTNGRVVVVWAGDNDPNDPGTTSIFGRICSAGGSDVGAEFQINTYAVDDQGAPVVGGLTDGGFVVCWNSWGQDASKWGVYGQRYDKQGIAIGSEFLVSTVTNVSQTAASVIGLADGKFLITWNDEARDGSDYGSFAKLYDSDGLSITSDFQINTYTTSFQNRSKAAALNDGGFVITWQSNGQDGSLTGVYARRYDASGTPVAAEFRVNATTNNEQRQPRVVGLSGGGFVVVWQSYSQDSSQTWGVYGRRYDSSGVAIGSEFRVNTVTADHQESAQVVALQDGGFAVVWQSRNQDGSGYGLFAQRFDALGNRVEREFRVNVDSAGDQATPSVSALLDGFAVAFRSSNGGGSEIMLTEISAARNFVGLVGDDFIEGSSVADRLDGAGGDDRLVGGDGDDWLIGGAGSDYLDGGFGIDEASYATSSSGVTITLDANGNASGASVGGGDAAGDTLVGVEGIVGSESGNDVLTGNDGANVFSGCGGDDTLSGGGGNDTLSGGSGNDLLSGGGGNDTYLLCRGSDNDAISEDDATIGNLDRLQFGEDVSEEQIWFRQVGDDLEISIIGTNDRATVADWYLGSDHQVERLETASGDFLLAADVQNLVTAMASFSPPALGETTLPPSYQSSLQPVIAANWQ